MASTALYNIEFIRGGAVFTRKEDGKTATIKGTGLKAMWEKYQARGENMETAARAFLTTNGKPVEWK